MEYRIGDLIELVTETNSENKYKAKDVKGMTITKEIIPTKANVKNTDLVKYIVVKNKEFIYNPRTHGRKIGLGFNNTGKTIIISWNNIAFRIKETCKDTILPEYLFMHFNRSEWDREACFQSWGSSTEVFSWEALCNMIINVPRINIQKKYVDIYNSLLDNQKAYEKGAEDLKLLCDAYIENLRRESESESIEEYIFRTDERNRDNKIKNVKGVSVYKEFRDPTSKVNKNELKNYKIVHPGEISFVQTTHNEKVFANALNNTSEDVVVSSVNEVFRVNKQKLLPGYLVMFFNRSEFDRYARYHSWGSARETFTWNDLIQVKIPIPSIEIQQDIVNIYEAYNKRKSIAEKLKEQIKNICPVLIVGAIKEGEKANG